MTGIIESLGKFTMSKVLEVLSERATDHFLGGDIVEKRIKEMLRSTQANIRADFASYRRGSLLAALRHLESGMDHFINHILEP